MATYFERCDPYLELKRRLGDFVNFYSDQKEILGSIVFSSSLVVGGESEAKTHIYFPICRLYVLCPKSHLPVRSPWKELPDSRCVLRTKTPAKDDLGCAHSVEEWREGELPPFLCSLTQHFLEDLLLSLWRMPLKLTVKMDREGTVQNMIQQIIQASEKVKPEGKLLNTFVIRSSFLQLCPLAEAVHWVDDCYCISSVEVYHWGNLVRVSVLVIFDWTLSNSCELSRENGLDVVLPHDVIVGFNREYRPIFSTEFGPLATMQEDKGDTLNAASWKSCMKALPNSETLWIKTFPRPMSVCVPPQRVPRITRSSSIRRKRTVVTAIAPSARNRNYSPAVYHSC